MANETTPGSKPKGGMSVREAGRKGGEVTAQRHGPAFYEEIGRKGGHKVRELIEKGKQGVTEAGEGAPADPHVE